MSPLAETAITIGKAVLLQLHQRNQQVSMDDCDYIPTLKSVITGVVSTVSEQGKIMKPRTRRGLQTDIECSWLPFSAYASNLL